MECFNLIYTHLSVQYLDMRTLTCAYISRISRVYLVNIPEPVQYDIYTLAFPFDLKCESVTYNIMHAYIHTVQTGYKFNAKCM